MSCKTGSSGSGGTGTGATPKSLGKALLNTLGGAGGSGGGAGIRGIIPSGYGFVVLTAVGSVMLLTWKALKVSYAREEHKVPYPSMYSSENMAFNCVQRAHQNTLENYPQFLFMLLIGGLEMPYFCTLGGWIWMMGRVCYAKGYYTGDPNKRSHGVFGTMGLMMCFAATTRFALRHLGWTS